MFNTKFMVYGLSPLMQQCIKNAVNDFGKRSIADILDTISDIPSLNQNEVNLIIFEIGREYERRIQNAG